jgi:DoxX-like family
MMVLVSHLLPPVWLIHVSVAAVWLYEGLWCKLLGGEPHQLQVIQAVPRYGRRTGALFLKLLGVVEVGIGVWVLSRLTPIACAISQTALLVILNGCGLLFARRVIHDPAGMIIKNFAFLVLVWVSASFSAWTCLANPGAGH